MRIGFDAKRFFFNRTGLGNYSRDLLRIMADYFPEHEYLKYTPKAPDITQHAYTDQIRTPRSFKARLLPSLWRSQWITADLKKDNIDIYHGLSGEIPMGLHGKGIKSVVTMHDLIFLQLPELYKPIDRFLYNKKFHHAVKHADKIVAISQQTKNDIAHHYSIPPEQIDVIYQGCHPAFKIQKNTDQKEALRSKYNLPANFLLNVGSIEPRKNAFQIVKAIEHLDIPLLLVGKETKYAQEIKRYINDKGLDKRIFLLQGFTMDELSCIYEMADIFIYPSKYEGFGIPIIEALYSSTPVITTNSGVFLEAAGPFSYYIDPENLEEMRYAITSVLSNGSMRKDMVEKGLQFVQRFNDDVLAQQWNTLYQSL